MFQYLSRYPTTKRTGTACRRIILPQHFLGVDVLELAARVSGRCIGHCGLKIDDAGIRVRRVPQDARPDRGNVSGLLAVSERASRSGKQKKVGSCDMFGAGFERRRPACRGTLAGPAVSGRANKTHALYGNGRACVLPADRSAALLPQRTSMIRCLAC